MILTLGVLIELPEKILQFKKSIPEFTNSCMFSGRIIDFKGDPIEGAEVIVLGNKGSGKTDSNGEFNFEVEEKAGMTVQILIKIDGVDRYNGRQTLPGYTTIKLEDKP